MDPLVLTLLVVGGIGLLVLVVAMVIGDLHFDADVDGLGVFSLPALAALIGGIGFIGAAVAALVPTGWPTGGRLAVALGAGVVGAVPLSYGAIRLTRGLMVMATDPTPTEHDLEGRLGAVITRIPAGGIGEIHVSLHGTRVKLAARSDLALPVGTPIMVAGVVSPTLVEVVSTAFEPPDRPVDPPPNHRTD
ncbi:hypothetical protein [Nakamurella leprariae]|uniref:NfeD-like C-terminal domain-containing protein n=1 Tax=Nakamurella leprariae TaxID=2803911 RepID=A0A938YJH4_9ACTN|nr:hypothetical protein [Nakamurella leprariae]MBM9469008.1 hypothetical protein [Nakamurella leprariae]